MLDLVEPAFVETVGIDAGETGLGRVPPVSGLLLIEQLHKAHTSDRYRTAESIFFMGRFLVAILDVIWAPEYG
jgi:hypothetical protein